MSDFLQLIREAHASLDAQDPAVLIIDGVTPAAGCPATTWPVEVESQTDASFVFRRRGVRVSVLRVHLTGELVEGQRATINGKSYTITGIMEDTVAAEFSAIDTRG